jgi:hypothetical protein
VSDWIVVAFISGSLLANVARARTVAPSSHTCVRGCRLHGCAVHRHSLEAFGSVFKVIVVPFLDSVCIVAGPNMFPAIAVFERMVARSVREDKSDGVVLICLVFCTFYRVFESQCCS